MTFRILVVTGFFLVFSSLVTVCVAELTDNYTTMGAADNLSALLLERCQYLTSINRPVEDYSEMVDVYFVFELKRFLEIDDTTQT